MADQEKQMILAAQRGQTDGYKYLMGRYGRQVQLLVAQMVGDSRDAEELTQDTFVRAFEHLKDFDPERASFQTWLCRIAYRSALNHLRSHGLATKPLEEGRCLPESDEANGTDERLNRLDEAIDRLRPEERTLLHLHYYEGCSLQEIAQVTGVAAGPLANRLQRIRQKLRKLLDIEH